MASSKNTSSIEASSTSFVTANSTPRKQMTPGSPGTFPSRSGPRSQSSRTTSFASSATTEWQLKNPAKSPMIVRIGGIVNPGQYWIRELTMSRTEGQESKGVNAEIFRFEKGLAARYNVDPKANPENEVTNPRPDMLVAVRPSFKSPHWYRGRIVTVSKAHSHDTMVKVFFIDYGMMFEEISCKKCVRVLPRIMTFTKGLARIVNLAGVRPLTLSVDFQLGMSSGNSTKAHQEMAANWSTYSQEFICKVLEQSQHKLALLTDWRQDVKKRIHGDLILLGFTKRISLSRLLVCTQHGDIFPDLIKSDLEAKQDRKIIGPRFTSIVALDSTSSSQTPDPIYDFTDMTAEELAENHVETPSRPDYEKAIKQENDWKILIPQKRMDKITKRNQKKNDWYNNCSIYKADTSFASTSEAPTEASLNTTGKLEILRRKMPKKSSPVKASDLSTISEYDSRCRKCQELFDSMADLEHHETLIHGIIRTNGRTKDLGLPPMDWDEIRNVAEFVDSDEDEEDRAIRMKKKEKKKEYEKRTIPLPAGIDMGKFIEETLERMPEPNIGPKQIIPELVRNPNLDLDQVMLDHDPMYYNCPDMSGLSFHDNDY